MMIIKGVLIGLGKIVPGVSGSLIAVSLGVYEKVIHILSNIKTINIKDFIYIFKLFVGILLSILLFSNLIIYLIDLNRMVTMYLFIGLIIPSMYDISDSIEKKNSILIIVSFIVSILLCGVFISFEFNTENKLIFILIGIIESTTMIIPGISGTAIFTTLGLYDKYINFIANLTSFNIDLIQLLYFILGLIISAIPIIKVLDLMFNKVRDKLYSIIYGITLSTIVLMAYNVTKNINYINILLSVVCLYIGIKISKKVNQLTVN